jgi:hypothetical protein
VSGVFRPNPSPRWPSKICHHDRGKPARRFASREIFAHDNGIARDDPTLHEPEQGRDRIKRIEAVEASLQTLGPSFGAGKSQGDPKGIDRRGYWSLIGGNSGSKEKVPASKARAPGAHPGDTLTCHPIVGAAIQLGGKFGVGRCGGIEKTSLISLTPEERRTRPHIHLAEPLDQSSLRFLAEHCLDELIELVRQRGSSNRISDLVPSARIARVYGQYHADPMALRLFG